MSKSFGRRIKSVRNKLGLTQQELAVSLGYSDKSMIAHIENGDNEMAVEKIALLASEYHIDANYLIGVKGYNKSIEDALAYIDTFKEEIPLTDGKEVPPSEYAQRLFVLYKRGDIDLETAKIALKRRYMK